MNSLLTTVNGQVDLALVYIAEAHASDEWPIGSQIELKQHGNVAERATVAAEMLAETGLSWPVVVDSDEFEQQYAPWPIRFYAFSRVGDNVYCNWISFPVEGGYYNWPEVERKVLSLIDR